MDKLGLETVVSKNPEILHREIEGETVLLDPDEGTYFALNDTGTAIWNLIEESVSLRSVQEQLLEQYEVSTEQLWEELTSLIRELASRKLIVIHTA